MTDMLVVKQRWNVAIAICRVDQVHGSWMNWRRLVSCRKIRHLKKSGTDIDNCSKPSKSVNEAESLPDGVTGSGC